VGLRFSGPRRGGSRATQAICRSWSAWPSW
jgi:hypothetical protein